MRLGYRFYDASVGRFLSRDPIRAGYNWYTYCDNDPVNAVDPEGLAPPDPHDMDFPKHATPMPGYMFAFVGGQWVQVPIDTGGTPGGGKGGTGGGPPGPPNGGGTGTGGGSGNGGGTGGPPGPPNGGGTGGTHVTGGGSYKKDGGVTTIGAELGIEGGGKNGSGSLTIGVVNTSGPTGGNTSIEGKAQFKTTPEIFAKRILRFFGIRIH